MANGEKDVKARLAAKGYRGPDLENGSVETPGCVSARSSYLRFIFRGALKGCEIWSLDIENAFLQADGLGRDVFLRVTLNWGPRDARRIWKLPAPAYGPDDAPMAHNTSPRKYLLNSGGSPARVGLKFRAPTFGPRLYSVLRKEGGANRDIAILTDDILGRGEPDASPKKRAFPEYRFGALKVQDTSFVHVGAEVSQENDFSVKLTREEFSERPGALELWALR